MWNSISKWRTPRLRCETKMPGLRLIGPDRAAATKAKGITVKPKLPETMILILDNHLSAAGLP
jgi:hypothetical protein